LGAIVRALFDTALYPFYHHVIAELFHALRTPCESSRPPVAYLVINLDILPPPRVMLRPCPPRGRLITQPGVLGKEIGLFADAENGGPAAKRVRRGKGGIWRRDAVLYVYNQLMLFVPVTRPR
jgi:hypothetical protein